jgi:SAM-dependent MidA family methyltransferase
MQHDSSSGLPGAMTGSSTPPTTPGDALVARIASRIAAAGGWMPFDDFMAEALYAPGLGYYSGGRRIFGLGPGSGSDFVTAPELSPFFGRALAVQVREALAASGTGRVYEFGAGSGALAEQLLEALDADDADDDGMLRIPADYTIVELSADLRERQQARLARFAPRVQWLDTWPAAIEGVVIGNEVLDAMPVKLLHRSGGRWHERGVVDLDPHGRWRSLPPEGAGRDGPGEAGSRAPSDSSGTRRAAAPGSGVVDLDPHGRSRSLPTEGAGREQTGGAGSAAPSDSSGTRRGAAPGSGVDADGGGQRRFAFADLDAPFALEGETQAAAALMDGFFPDGSVTEIHPQAQAFVATLAQRLQRGAAFVIDYGFPEHEYYHPQRVGGTLMCHQAHRADGDPLADIGAKDITAHVNFSGIALAAQEAGMTVLGYTSQARFLINCGLVDLLAAASVGERANAQKLVNEHEMGELFKVIALARGCELDPIGFRAGDRSHML